MITTQEVQQQISSTLYQSYIEDCSIEVEDLPDNTAIEKVAADFNSFERYGKNQKQWWRSPVLQMAGGDVHFFWNNGEIFQAVTSDKPTMVNGKPLRVVVVPASLNDVIVAMLIAEPDTGYYKVGWREFLRVSGVK